jgi:hypothetical protein
MTVFSAFLSWPALEDFVKVHAVFLTFYTFYCFVASLGVDGVPLPFVVKFIKLAFSYEQWEVLEALLQPFMTLLKTQAQVVQTPAYAMSLQLLAAMEPFFNTTGRKQQKKAAATENATNEYLHGTSGGRFRYSRSDDGPL